MWSYKGLCFWMCNQYMWIQPYYSLDERERWRGGNDTIWEGDEGMIHEQNGKTITMKWKNKSKNI